MKFYESAGVSEHPTYFVRGARSKAQTGGSIGKTGENKIVPIEPHSQPSLPPKPSKEGVELKVKFVSPAQQTVEQAESEIHRENGITGKRSRSTKQSATSKKRKKKSTTNKDDGNQF